MYRGYWIARSSRAMTAMGYKRWRQCTCGELRVSPGSEIRPVRRRQRLDVLLEGIAELSFGAARFDHRALHAPPAVDHLQRRDEDGGILDGNFGLKRLAVFDKAIALDHMQ